MSTYQVYSLIIILFLFLFIFTQRKTLFALNNLSIFMISNILLSLFGLLLIPWFKSSIGEGILFQDMMFYKVSDEEVLKASLLISVGLLIVYISYQFTNFIRTGKLIIKGRDLLKPENKLNLGTSERKVYTVASTILIITLTLLIPKTGMILNGLTSFLIGDPSQLLAARRGVTSSYFLVILIYNVIPFFSVASLIIYFINKKRFAKYYAITYMLFATGFLLIIFQKRPLILFFITCFLAFLWGNREKYYAIYEKIKKISKVKFILTLTFLFSTLVSLYFLMTNYGRTGQMGVFETLWTLVLVALSRIFGRLALPSAMYTHYFPNIEAHYGITNIGFLSKIFNYDLYLDTPTVFYYFYGEEGSVAISSLIDLYGGFGIGGWLIGAVFIGVMLNTLDIYLNKLPKTGINILFIIFTFVFSFYLSQASIPRSLMGYGGLFFLISWLILRTRLKKE